MDKYGACTSGYKSGAPHCTFKVCCFFRLQYKLRNFEAFLRNEMIDQINNKTSNLQKCAYYANFCLKKTRGEN